MFFHAHTPSRTLPRHRTQVRGISDKVQKLLHDAFNHAKDYKPKKVGGEWMVTLCKSNQSITSIDRLVTPKSLGDPQRMCGTYLRA